MYTKEDAVSDGRADYLYDLQQKEIEIKELSFLELKDIIENFIRVCEKTAQYDKVGQSYYNAKKWIKSH